MGIDYTIHLAVGFRISEEELVEAFSVRTEEVSHMEKRFDPRTGERLADEKVVDRKAGTTLMWDGEDIGDEIELAEQVAKKAGCEYWGHGAPQYGGATEYIFGPKFETTPSLDEGKVTCGGAVELGTFIDATFNLNEIKHALEALGLKPGKAVVMPAMWVC